MPQCAEALGTLRVPSAALAAQKFSFLGAGATRARAFRADREAPYPKHFVRWVDDLKPSWQH